MKLIAALTGALLATSVSAGFGISINTKPDQTALAGELAVPGDNPLNYCTAPDKDILEIKKVDLSPNPPSA